MNGTHENTPQPTTSFEQLEALAHVEVDRFCASCGYNLRGQPVRRESNTQLLLCRCPECGTFAPANDTSVQFDPWKRRGAKLLWGLWVLFCVYLLVGAGGAMTAAMVGIMEELDQTHRRWEMTSPHSPEQMQALAQRLERQREQVRAAGVLAVPAIGLIAGMIWPIIFPHWRRWGYHLLAVGLPLLAAGILFIILKLGGPSVQQEDRWLMRIMPLGLIAAGVIGIALARPLARGLLTLVLPPRMRAAFSYLWMIDGKKPPSAKT